MQVTLGLSEGRGEGGCDGYISRQVMAIRMHAKKINKKGIQTKNCNLRPEKQKKTHIRKKEVIELIRVRKSRYKNKKGNV